MRTSLAAALGGLAALFTLADAPKPGPPSEPILLIETGRHTATIRRIAADAQGRILVTGSYDKTARIWDLATGDLLRVLRPPIGEGDEGKIEAVAITPDGATVAAAGWTRFGHSIDLFDTASGRLRRRITGLPDAIFDLAVNSDGTLLAASLGGISGLRVFRLADGAEVARHSGYGERSSAVDFAHDGRLVTSSHDGQLRLYDRDLRLVKSVPAPAGSPRGVAFSPDGTSVAVGYAVSKRVDVFFASNLNVRFWADYQGTNSSFPSVAWSTDGASLYAAGRFDVGGKSLIRRWPNGGRGAFTDLEGPPGTVMDLVALPNGRLAFGSGEPAWGVLDPFGKSVHFQRPVIGDLQGMSGDSFQTDAAGTTVRFAYDAGSRPFLLSLPSRRVSLLLEVPSSAAPQLTPPRTAAPGLKITGLGTLSPKVQDQPLALDAFETSRSLAIAPDGGSFLLGNDRSIRSFHHRGRLRWRIPIPDVAWSVHLARDGRLALAALGDGTIRWYRAEDGQELLAFFLHTDGERWVLWTPSGYYDTSVDGEDLMGWHVNRGFDEAADFFPAWHFRDRFRRPEVIDRILETLDEAEALRLAGLSPTVPPPRGRSRRERGQASASSR